jgi:radical SAM superfamily enzyme YgiQ (UPF0313 family)
MEAIKYCDSVVIGEAESVWHKVLAGFENQKLEDFYMGRRMELTHLPIPRRDLFKKRYKIQTVQTSKGCPFNCEFCSVTKFCGGAYRQRPIGEVINEVAMIKDKVLLFADDNLFGVGANCERRAIDLFKELKPLNKKWASQTSINVADNELVLKAAAESGAIGFFVGMESLNKMVLKSMGKSINLRKGIKGYKRTIKVLHNYGITVTGAFVVGNDEDRKDVFKAIINFMDDADLDRVQATISTPLPGTRLFKRLQDEGRIKYSNYPVDWTLYDVYHAVFEPKHMTIEELEGGLLDIYRYTSSKSVLFRKAFRTFINTKKIFSSALSYIYNQNYGSAVLAMHRGGGAVA